MDIIQEMCGDLYYWVGYIRQQIFSGGVFGLKEVLKVVGWQEERMGEFDAVFFCGVGVNFFDFLIGQLGDFFFGV